MANYKLGKTVKGGKRIQSPGLGSGDGWSALSGPYLPIIVECCCTAASRSRSRMVHSPIFVRSRAARGAHQLARLEPDAPRRVRMAAAREHHVRSSPHEHHARSSPHEHHARSSPHEHHVLTSRAPRAFLTSRAPRAHLASSTLRGIALSACATLPIAGLT